MALSIRNQLPGRVSAVATGGAMAAVKVTVDGGELTASITREAVAELGLEPGVPVVALIKSTEISLANATTCRACTSTTSSRKGRCRWTRGTRCRG